MLTTSAQTLTNYKDELGGGQIEFNKKEYVEGTRYYYDDFIMGEVFYDSYSKIIHLPLKFNLHNDEFVYVENDSVFAFAEPNRIDKIVLEDEVFIYLDSSKNFNISGWVKKWRPELPAIITKMKIDFFEKVSAQPFAEDKPDRFVRAADRHYLMKSENEIISITSVKELIKILGDHSSELSEFAKEEKISRASGADLTRLLEYYRALENYL